MRSLEISFSPWRRGPRTQAKVDASALRLLVLVGVVELCLWGFIKPYGRPLTVVGIVKSRWAAYGRWEAHQASVMDQAHAISSQIEVLPKDHPLAACCPKEDPGVDAVCLCKPGGGPGDWDFLPARPWEAETHKERPDEEEMGEQGEGEKPSADDDPRMWQSVQMQLESEVPDPSEMLHLPLDKFLKELAKYCRAKVIMNLRNSAAEKRLDAILNYRKRIRIETGCNPETYDPEHAHCGAKFNQAAKLSRGEWVKQQEEEKRQRMREKQREMWQHELMLEEAGDQDQEEEGKGQQDDKEGGAEEPTGPINDDEGAADLIGAERRRERHHHRQLHAKVDDMIVGLGGRNKKAREHMELSKMAEDGQSAIENSRPVPLTLEEIEALNDPPWEVVEPLTKKCVEEEGHERVAAHRLAQERKEKAAREERLKKAEVARAKEMLQRMEEKRKNTFPSHSELEEQYKAGMDKAVKTLIAASKTKEDKMRLSRAAATKPKELSAIKTKCESLESAIESLQGELDSLGGGQLVEVSGSAAVQLQEMKQRAKAELDDCQENLSTLETYRERLEVEAKRQVSEAASLDRLAKLAKGQRGKMSSSGHGF